MENFKKLNRESLKSISGGALLNECQVDLDCGPAGCAWCTDLRGRKVCLYLFNTPIQLGCPDVN